MCNQNNRGERLTLYSFFYGETMNFIEFEKNVKVMKQKLEEESVDLSEAKIEYTRFDGYDCLWAIKGDKIISYFKW